MPFLHEVVYIVIMSLKAKPLRILTIVLPFKELLVLLILNVFKFTLFHNAFDYQKDVAIETYAIEGTFEYRN